MSFNRIASLGVLAVGAVFGYVVAGSLYQPSQEAPTSVELPAPAMDVTCSTASPGTAMCEMPGEISRADYFRLGSTANAAQAAPQLRPEGSASADVAAEKSPATIMDQTIKQIRVELKVRDAFPMLPKPANSEK
jgi:hypothetical protein